MPHITKAQIEKALEALESRDDRADNAITILQSLLQQEESQPAPKLVTANDITDDMVTTALKLNGSPSSYGARGAIAASVNAYNAVATHLCKGQAK